MRDKHSLENFGILENPRFFWNFAEFQKNPRFFRNFGGKTWKTQCFFGIYYEIQKKTLGFLRFLDQIPKKPRFFFGILQNSKKTLSFPKFQEIHQSPQIFLEFWNFGKPKVFFEFWRIPKNPRFFWNIGRKPWKTQGFLEFIMKFQKNLGFFKVFGSNSKKA